MIAFARYQEQNVEDTVHVCIYGWAMTDEFFVERNGKLAGPFSPPELKAMASKGKILKTDLIRKGEGGKPCKAENVKGLFAAESTAIANINPTQLSKVPKRVDVAVSSKIESSSTGEILSKTWSNVIDTGKKTAGVVTTAMSKLRPTTPALTPSQPAELKENSTPNRVGVPDSTAGIIDCPFCGEEIKAVAKKCKHCGEILDVVMRQHADSKRIPQAPIHQPVIKVVNNNHANAVIGDSGYGPKRWSPLLAAFLSFLIPGLGQLYKGQFLNAVAWFVFVLIGYIAFIIPGVILHLFCVAGAASGDPYR